MLLSQLRLRLLRIPNEPSRHGLEASPPPAGLNTAKAGAVQNPPLISFVMHLYETHLAVRNTEKSKVFYVEIVGLSFAHRDPKRDIVFLWIGENRVSMLGLW
jgi:hypothetical protein